MKNGDRVRLTRMGRLSYVRERERFRKGVITCVELPNPEYRHMVAVLWDGLKLAQFWRRDFIEPASDLEPSLK